MAGVPQTGYQPQVGAGGSAPFAGASPDAFGAGVGAQIEHAGAVEGEAALAAHRLDLERQKASEASDIGVQLANLRAQAPAAIQQLRDTADPSNPQAHVQQVGQWLQQQTGQILGNVKNTQLAQHFEGVVAEMSASIVGDETGWAHAFRNEHIAANTDESARTLADTEAHHPSDNVGDSLNLFAQMVKGLGADANTTEKRTREGQRQIVLGHLDGRIDQNPQGAKALIASGVFDRYGLTRQDIEQLNSKADVEIRRRAVEQHQAIEQRASDATTFIDNIGKRVENHIPVPQADFQQAGQILADPDLGPKLRNHAFDLGRWQTVDGVNREYQGAAPQTISARLTALDAEIAKQGDKVDPTHVIERNVLAAMLPQKREALIRDPLTLYAQAGGQVTPVEWSDPASLQARLGQAKMAQGRNGGMLTVLTQDEASELEQELAKGNAAGRVDVAARLAAGGAEFAVAAARQIAPGNQHFQTAAALAAMGPAGMAVARDSLLGSDALAAHKGIVNEKAAQQLFGRLSLAMTGLDPAAQHGIYDTAMGIFATRQARAGKTEAWPALNDTDQRQAFSSAVDAALGATRRPNGEIAGGIAGHNNHFVLLPTNMTRSEFEGAFGRATPADFARAAGGATPVYANGIAPRIPEFKAMQLEAVGDGVYRVKLGNSYLLRKGDHAPYEFDARKLMPTGR